jgi:hypothetical protein
MYMMIGIRCFERYGLLLFADKMLWSFDYFSVVVIISRALLPVRLDLHAIHVGVMLHLLLIFVDSTGAGAFLYSEQDILVSFVSNKTMAKIEFKN